MTEEFVYEGAPRRLSRIISGKFPLFTYGRTIMMIEAGDVRVDGVRTRKDVRVETGSVLRIYAGNLSLAELYADENLLAVYKPKGLPSQGEFSAESIVSAGNPGVILCHRLDTNTDGVLVFARNERAFAEIKRASRENRVEKTYEARVYGTIPEDAEYADGLTKDAEAGRVRITGKNEGTAVRTRVRVLSRDGETTLIEAVIHRGKTHQIRAQLAAHGHFVLGDGKYGRDDINRRFGYKKQQLTAKKVAFSFERDSFLYYLNGKEISLRDAGKKASGR